MNKTENSIASTKNYGSLTQINNANDSENLQNVYSGDSAESSQQFESDTPEKQITNNETTCLQFFKNSKIEIFITIYMVAYTMKSVTLSTMGIEKVCKVHLDYSVNICDNLQSINFTNYSKEVEKVVNNYITVINLMNMIPSFLIACVLGPWSDKYGRKLPLIVMLTGTIIDSSGSILCAYFIDTPMEYLFIPAVITGLSGGNIVALMVFYSFVSDTTAARMRTLKYALLELAIGVGTSLGTLAGGWLFKLGSYISVFATSFVGHVFGIAYVVSVIEETRGIGNKDDWLTKLRNFFRIDSLKESFIAAVRKRPNQGRKQIWLLILASSVITISTSASSTISYIYAYDMFKWSNTKYSTVTAIFTVLGIISIFIIIIILRIILKVGDPTLGLVGTVSHLIKNIVMGIAAKEGVYYLANVLGLWSSITVLATRARISKVVCKSDSGKIFAFLSTAESIFPIVATAVFTQVFNASLSFFPGLVFLVLAAMTSISLGVYIWLACLPSFDYENLADDSLDEQLVENATNKKEDTEP